MVNGAANGARSGAKNGARYGARNDARNGAKNDATITSGGLRVRKWLLFHIDGRFVLKTLAKPQRSA